jgi:hypothetical protein
VTLFVLKKRTVQGKKKIVDYPEVTEMAERLGVTAAQVLVAWGVARGYSVIPKSVNKGKQPVMDRPKQHRTHTLAAEQTASSQTSSKSR